ncbi:MAG: hypothetical protein JO042_12575, partial [Sinobacteraceae bacterium]|nr:hypothetical protein [Nevskiaceae bacterium]
KGDTLGNTPWALTFTPEYHFSVLGGKDAYVRAQDQFHSHNAGAFPGNNPNSISYDPDIPLAPATNLLNLRAGLIWSGFDTSIFVNNALNSQPPLRLAHPVVGDPLYNDITFRPLTAGVTVTYRY